MPADSKRSRLRFTSFWSCGVEVICGTSGSLPSCAMTCGCANAGSGIATLKIAAIMVRRSFTVSSFASGSCRQYTGEGRDIVEEHGVRSWSQRAGTRPCNRSQTSYICYCQLMLRCQDSTGFNHGACRVVIPAKESAGEPPDLPPGRAAHLSVQRRSSSSAVMTCGQRGWRACSAGLLAFGGYPSTLIRTSTTPRYRRHSEYCPWHQQILLKATSAMHRRFAGKPKKTRYCKAKMARYASPGSA